MKCELYVSKAVRKRNIRKMLELVEWRMVVVVVVKFTDLFVHQLNVNVCKASSTSYVLGGNYFLYSHCLKPSLA